ncbi:MAG: DNA repair protein RecO C-terminal domain-containing protein [Planctomycetes bacterium]|nr:DNA repair protein RecO C-terminal domain-containing protein [Planctomycetota bacterium]
MTPVRTEIIVLRTRRFSESSVVATLLSRDLGRLDVLAKGARREKSPLFGHLDLYQREEALIYRRPPGSLDLLTEAAFVDEHAGLRFFPPAFAAAGFLADLTAEATLPGEPQPQLFAVLAAALAMLSELGDLPARAGLAAGTTFSAGDRRVLAGRILKLAIVDMLGWLGFGLELRRCVICGAVPDPEKTAYLSRGHGGLICRSCRSQARDGIPASAAALASLRGRDATAENLETALTPSERRRWLRFLVDYAQHALERPLRGKRVLYQLLEG